MKTKKLKYLFFASLLTLSFSTMISCSAEIKQGEADNKNKQNNETKNNIPDETKNDQSNSIKKNLNLENWIDDIKDSAQNEHPSFFITWRAAQIYIASFISMIAQLEMMKKSGDNQQFNDVILLTSDLENKYKKTIENKEEQKFDFKKLLDDKLGQKNKKHFLKYTLNRSVYETTKTRTMKEMIFIIWRILWWKN